MTVILGVHCSEAVILATDSQATAQIAGGVPVKLDASKVEKLGKYALYAGTGAQGCTQRVTEALEPHASKFGITKNKTDIASGIHRLANPIQKESAQSFVQFAPNAQVESWGGIFIGWAKDGPWMMEIDLNGGHQFHDPFVATGSGYSFAYQALSHVNHFDIGNQPLKAAKAVAYRAIETTCLVSAYGVGLPVQMGVVTKDGAELLSAEEIDTIEDFVNIWKAKEAESLGALVPTPDIEEEDAGEGLDPPA